MREVGLRVMYWLAMASTRLSLERVALADFDDLLCLDLGMARMGKVIDGSP